MKIILHSLFVLLVAFFVAGTNNWQIISSAIANPSTTHKQEYNKNIATEEDNTEEDSLSDAEDLYKPVPFSNSIIPDFNIIHCENSFTLSHGYMHYQDGLLDRKGKITIPPPELYG